jgi:hypothetical protein
MKELKRLWHIFIAKSVVSYVSITGPDWWKFFYTALSQFKESGFQKPEEWFPFMDRKALSLEINADGKECKDEFLSSLRGEYVSFSIDAYTLYHRHQIAAMLCAPHLGIRPRLVYLKQESNAQESYARAGLFLETLARYEFVCSHTFCHSEYASLICSQSYTVIFFFFFCHRFENVPPHCHGSEFGRACLAGGGILTGARRQLRLPCEGRT